MTRYWPLGKGRIVTSPFGPRSGGFHAGVDFGFPGGSGYRPVYAPDSGRVIFAGAAQGYGGPDPAGWVVIQTDSGVWELGHVIRRCNVGDWIEAGQIIAIINPSSATNGGVAPHVHASYMPGGYDPAAKQDPMKRLAGAKDPDVDFGAPDPGRAPVVLPPIAKEDAVGWTGDPVWLADVLRAEGLKVIEHDGWRNRGHGDFKDIRGVICHHTAGGGTNDWKIVQNGRPDLAGPLAQLVLERDGTYRVIAAGVCWHAGRGSWPGWPTNNANWHTIGIEAVNNGVGQPWPAVQIDAYKRGCAAIARRVSFGADKIAGHKEYSSEGKIDPAGIDMPSFRRDVAALLTPSTGGFLMALSDAEQKKLLEDVAYIKDQLGPGFDVWGEDGDLGRNAKGQRRTFRAGLAALMRKAGA